MLNDANPLDGYREPYGLLCGILQDGTNEWRLELDQNLGSDAMVWQPYPDMHSIGGVILHMIDAEVFWFEQVALGIAPDPEEEALLMGNECDQDSWRWPTPPQQPLSWYLALQDRIRARTLESIKRWGPPDQVVEWRGRESTLRWIFGHVIQHEAYHGGQAVLLSRLLELQSK